MTINKGNIGLLFVIWAFAFILGLSISLNVPFVLLVIGTLIMLLV